MIKVIKSCWLFECYQKPLYVKFNMGICMLLVGAIIIKSKGNCGSPTTAEEHAMTSLRIKNNNMFMMLTCH